jgi:DNA-binding NarL/FixJ family response regulator
MVEATDGRLRVAVVSRHRASAEALVSACERRGLAAGIARPHDLKLTEPTVVLVDGTDGTSIAGLFGFPDPVDAAPVVVLTTELPDRTRQAGRRWLHVDMAMDDLVSALTSSAERDATPSASSAGAELEAGLTSRERDVLVELVQQGDVGKVAVRLGISELTVRSHLRNLFPKLRVNSRAEAAAWALRHGLASAAREGSV